MRRLVSALALAATLFAGSAPARALRQEQPHAAQGEVQLSAQEVLLDLVVSDKKGRPITDLKPEEVEVYENGAKQDVTSFGLVRVGPAAAGEAAAADGTSAPAAIAKSDFNGVNLILIVVDRTSVTVDNLTQVYKATEAFVNQRLAVNDLVAVFVSTNRPVLLQNFTNNKPKLLTALKNATAGTTVILQEATGDAARAELQTAQNNTIHEPGGSSESDEQVDRRRNERLTADGLGIDTFLSSLRDQIQTLSVIDSVIALTHAYAEIPGRKSMVLYSEGFTLADETKGPFDAMVAAANRANFTINTIDAGGLDAAPRRSSSDTASDQAYLESNDRMLVHEGESGMGRYLNEHMNANDESLSRLAKETGGVIVRNTNDLGKGFDQIANDLRSYYALSYQPTKAELDGSFRTLDVRVARKDVVVRSRKGYYAVPGGGSAVLLPFESPVLAMLNAATASKQNDVKIAFKTERFAGAGTWRVPVILAVDGGALAAAARDPKSKAPDDGSSVFETDAVVLVRDASGAIVGKLSRASHFRAPKDRTAEFKTRMLPLTQFPRTLDLAPGAYTLQVGVFDPNGKKGTVIERRITLPALPPAGQPVLSSLVLSRATAGIGPNESSAAGDPLVFGGTKRIVPNATGIFEKSKGDRLIAYFTLRATPSTSYEMLIQFMQGDKLVVGTPPQALPPTDANGLVAFSPILPLDGFQPGSYRAVLYIVPTGSNQPIATSMTPFTIAP